jgi:hypothetical protein
VLLTTKSFYQGSLLLPLVVPLIAYGILRWTEPSEDLGMFLGVLVVSLYAAGLPYTVLAVALLWWGRAKTAADFRSAAFWSPFMLVPIFLIYIVLASGSFEGVADLGNIVFTTFFILVIGYLYVFAVDWTAEMLRGRGVLT